MSIDNLADWVDQSILSLANKTTKKFNEYCGGTKYDLERLCGYVTIAGAVVSTIMDHGQTPLVLMSGSVALIKAGQIYYSYESEKIEAESDEILDQQVLKNRVTCANYRFPLLMFGAVYSVLSYKLPLQSAVPTVIISACFGESGSMYFHSCDMTPRKPGRLFEKPPKPKIAHSISE